MYNYSNPLGLEIPWRDFKSGDLLSDKQRSVISSIQSLARMKPIDSWEFERGIHPENPLGEVESFIINVNDTKFQVLHNYGEYLKSGRTRKYDFYLMVAADENGEITTVFRTQICKDVFKTLKYKLNNNRSV